MCRLQVSRFFHKLCKSATTLVFTPVSLLTPKPQSVWTIRHANLRMVSLYLHINYSAWNQLKPMHISLGRLYSSGCRRKWEFNLKVEPVLCKVCGVGERQKGRQREMSAQSNCLTFKVLYLEKRNKAGKKTKKTQKLQAGAQRFMQNTPNTR